jgi:putative SOS response-associated peptidase YedK
MGIEQAEMDFVPRYNVAPTQLCAIVVNDSSRTKLHRARWGLIPSWAADEKIGASLINARCETAAAKPAFRNSFKKRRCLVLSDGFYEWRKTGKTKQPYFIHLKGGRPFAFAGLWDRWNEVETFTILTVEPNEISSQVHNRMPVILRDEDCSRWLDLETPSTELSKLLVPFGASEMESFPVGRMVNSAKVDCADCLKPVPAPLDERHPPCDQSVFVLESE